MVKKGATPFQYRTMPKQDEELKQLYRLQIMKKKTEAIDKAIEISAKFLKSFVDQDPWDLQREIDWVLAEFEKSKGKQKK